MGGLVSLVVVGGAVAFVVIYCQKRKAKQKNHVVTLQLHAQGSASKLLIDEPVPKDEDKFGRISALVNAEGVNWKMWTPVEQLIKELQTHQLSGRGRDHDASVCEKPCPWCQALDIVEAAYVDTEMLLQCCLENKDYSGTEIYVSRLQVIESVLGQRHRRDRSPSGAESTLEFVAPGLLLDKDRFNPDCDVFLGRGASAIVSKGFLVETIGGKEVRTVVAVKEVGKTGERTQQHIVKEYLLLSKKLQPQHPNVIRLHDLKTTSTTFCVVMECCHFSVARVPADFEAFLRDEHSSGALVLNALVQDMLRGLQFLHSRQVAHCDVKPANMLVQFDRSGKPRSLKKSHWDEAQLKLSDFGVSRLLEETKAPGMMTATMTAHAWMTLSDQGAHIAGTAAFMSAELLRKFRSFTNNEGGSGEADALPDNDTLKLNDAFGCGCSIAVLCGIGEQRHPFFQATFTNVSANILAGRRVQLSSLGIRNPLHLELVDHLTSSEVGHRWNIQDAVTKSSVFATQQRMHKSHDWSILLDHISFRQKPEGSCWNQLLQLPSAITGSKHFARMKLDIKTTVQRLQESQYQLPQKLDEDALVALVAYTLDNKSARESNVYFACNVALRERDTNPTAFNRWKGYLYHLMRALDILPAQALTVYRGVVVPEGLDSMKQNYQKGRPVQWRSFTSTSLDLTSCKLFVKNKARGVIFKLDVVSGRDIQQYSCFSGEAEILLTPNTRFVVTRALYRDSEGYACIDLVESAGSELAF